MAALTLPLNFPYFRVAGIFFSHSIAGVVVDHNGINIFSRVQIFAGHFMAWGGGGGGGAAGMSSLKGVATPGIEEGGGGELDPEGNLWKLKERILLVYLHLHEKDLNDLKEKEWL